MDDLWRAIAELAASVHGDRVALIAEALGRLASVGEFERARHAFGPTADRDEVERVKSAWSAVPQVGPREMAAAFMAVAQAGRIMDRRGTVELVWTGPSTGLIATRHTEQVILEVIDSSRSDMFLVSYVFYPVSSVVAALNAAVNRGVDVRILLESCTEHGGAVKGDGIKSMHESVSGARIYIWAPAVKQPEGERLSAVVHAKCAVADGSLAFVTSANLTSAALERNMELGLLIRSGPIPGRLRAHLEALATTGLIEEWGR